jgi:hypothetical protein
MPQTAFKLAVITYENRGSYATENVADEDEILIHLLQELNIDFTLEIWSDPQVNWQNYSHLLIKSPWDYFDRYQEFVKWCSHIQHLGLKVYNDLTTILWNTHKKYLLDIQKLGFPIVPTQILNANTDNDLSHYFDFFNTHQLIIKPAVSGGAKNTLKIDRDNCEENQKLFNQWVTIEDFMVQPFMEEVAVTGEYSYIFFNHQFSHAVLKSAKPGDFRVQHFFGGTIHPVNPSANQIQYFERMLDSLKIKTLYARIDGIWDNGVFYLMELELIEPYLFLFTDANAIQNYKKAIEELVLNSES